MAKKALLVPADKPNDDPYYAAMEDELLERINSLGIGRAGIRRKDDSTCCQDNRSSDTYSRTSCCSEYKLPCEQT